MRKIKRAEHRKDFIKITLIVLSLSIFYCIGCKDNPEYPTGEDIMLVEEDSLDGGLYYADWYQVDNNGQAAAEGKYTVHMRISNFTGVEEFSIESNAPHVPFYHPPEESLPENSYYCAPASEKYAPKDTVVIVYRFPNTGRVEIFIRKE